MSSIQYDRFPSPPFESKSWQVECLIDSCWQMRAQFLLPLRPRPICPPNFLHRLTPSNMSKRERSPAAMDEGVKRTRVAVPVTFAPFKVASAKAGAAVDAKPPLTQLVEAMSKVVKNPAKGDCVVYWMRMTDMRCAFPSLLCTSFCSC